MKKEIKELIERTRVQLIDIVDHALEDEDVKLVVADEWRNAPWYDLEGFNTYGVCWSRRRGYNVEDEVYQFKLNFKFSKYVAAGYLDLENVDVERTILNVVVHEYIHGMRANRGGAGGHDVFWYRLAKAVSKALYDYYDVDVGEIERYVNEDEIRLIDAVDLKYVARYALINEEKRQVILYKTLPGRATYVDVDTRDAYDQNGYPVFTHAWSTYDLNEAGTVYDPDAVYTRKRLLELLESGEFKFFTKVK